MHITPIQYFLKYSVEHLKFSWMQWNLILYCNRASELEVAHFWYYLGALPDVDFFESKYHTK